MIKVIKIGLTIEHEGETLLLQEGDMPKDCVVVFLDKESWEDLKPLVEVGE